MVRQFAISLLAVLAAAQAQTLSEIGVTGSKRLPAAAIAKATGLRTGQHVSKDDLEKATHTLFDTGLFTAVNYRYRTQPTAKGPAWSVNFEVVEDRADTVGRLDIPGFEEEKLWQDLKQADGLLDTRLPSNEQAAGYYRRAIEDFRAKPAIRTSWRSPPRPIWSPDRSRPPSSPPIFRRSRKSASTGIGFWIPRTCRQPHPCCWWAASTPSGNCAP
jgi:hypothetical protein